MAIEQMMVRVTGVTNLLMHSDRMVNPFDPLTLEKKELTAKKTNKTDADLRRIMAIEIEGSLYWDEDLGVIIPGDNFRKCAIEAARLTRNGPQFQRGFWVTTDAMALNYKWGKAPLATLANHERFRLVRGVAQGKTRIPRARPFFREWSFDAPISYDTSQIKNEAQILNTLTAAGSYVGLGDWRIAKGGRYGAFRTEKIRG